MLLRQAIRESRRAMQPFRQNRIKFVKQLVGRHYSKSGSPHQVPLNWIDLFTYTLARFLVPDNPQILLTAKEREKIAAFGAVQEHGNETMRKMNLGETLRSWAFEALFAPVSALMVGPNQWSGTHPFTGQDLWSVTADVVDFEDLIVDMGAPTLSSVTYIGHLYDVPLEQAQKSDTFGRKVRSRLTQTDLSNSLEGETSIRGITRGLHAWSRQEYSFEPMVRLLDVWLPDYGVVLTMPEELDDVVLHERKWDGPQRGPYHLLKFKPVPGQTMGVPPVATVYDMHDALNSVIRKSVRQAQRQKTVLGYRSGKERDAENIRDADDGEIVPMTDTGAVQEFRFGGADGPGTALVMMIRDWLDFASGNLSAIAGLGPQSETATQDQMILQSASKLVDDMQKRLVRSTTDVCRDLVDYIIRDDLLNTKVEMRHPGYPEALLVPLRHKDLPADMTSDDVELDVYSMQYQTPSSRMQTINALLDRVLQAWPIIQENGGAVDLQVYFEEMGRLTQWRRLSELVTFDRPGAYNGQAANGQGAGGPSRPPTTNRITTRVNRPGTTRQGKEQALIAHLQGMNRQPSEMAAAGRGVG